jgi:Tol biopolymer transport system component
MKQSKYLFIVLFLMVGASFLLADANLQTTAKELLEKAIYLEETKGDLQEAIKVYTRIVQDFEREREIAAQAQLRIGYCHEKLGGQEAQKAYQKVIDRFPDQTKHVAAARARLSELTLTASTPKAQEIAHIYSAQDDGFWLENQSLSPDGNKLLGIDISFGQNVAYKDLSTGKLEHITKFDWESEAHGWTYHVTWSPDGKEVAFSFMDHKKDFAEIRISDLSGSSRTITRCASEEYILPCDWFPDGRKILALLRTKDRIVKVGAIALQDGSFEPIYEMKMPDEIRRTGNLARFYNFNLSPDGNIIAFQKPGEGALNIYTIDIRTKTVHPVTAKPANDRVPLWSPDGNYIAFISNRLGSRTLWAIPMGKDGRPNGEPFLIREDMAHASLMDWTKAGFSYSNWIGSTNIYVMAVDPQTGAPAGKPQQLDFKPTGSNTAPVFSPDGKHIAFVSNSQEGFRQRDIVVYPLSGGNVRRFRIPSSNFRSSLYDVRWHPEGTGISFSCGASNKTPGWEEGMDDFFRFFSLDLKTGEWQTWPLYSGWSRTEWRPDGQGFYYSRREENLGPWSIMEYDLETDNERVFYGEGGGHHLRLSRDRTKLAYGTTRSPDGRIEVLDTKTGEKIKEFENFARPVWSPDGKYLMAQGKGADGPSYHIISYADGSSQMHDISKSLPKGRMIFFDWSPRGDQMVFDFRFNKYDTYVIHNVIPLEKK